MTDDLAGGDSLEVFTRREWAALGTGTNPWVAGPDFGYAVAVEPSVASDEIADVYVPICRVLGVRMAQRQKGSEGNDDFPASDGPAAPFFVGIAGGVAVGKSTTARVLQSLLGRTKSRPAVDLITTDSFLHPNRVLSERGPAGPQGISPPLRSGSAGRHTWADPGRASEVTLPVYSVFHRATTSWPIVIRPCRVRTS